MESKRQLKVSKLLYRELAEIFQEESRTKFAGSMITVTKVHVSRDLSVARVYLSLFATKDKSALFKEIKEHSREIRGKLGFRIKNQLRGVPELELFHDDSLDYIENIEKLLDEDSK
jgi:ribosome-binding factor A